MPISVNLARRISDVENPIRQILLDMMEELERNRKESIGKDEFAELKEAVLDNTLSIKALSQAQQRTETKVEELTEAQKQTEMVMRKLAERQDQFHWELKQTNRNLGGIANTVGYTLENQAYRHLPALLKQDHKIDIQGRLLRGHLPRLKGDPPHIEVNILGDATRDGAPVKIIGESKAQLSIKKIDHYLDKIVPLIDTGGVPPFVVLVAHMTKGPDVAEHAKSRGVALYLSYDFPV